MRQDINRNGCLLFIKSVLKSHQKRIIEKESQYTQGKVVSMGFGPNRIHVR